MKSIPFAFIFRRIGWLLFTALVLGGLQGCCDSDLYISGQARDASSGAPLDSVSVTFFHSVKRNARVMGSALSDSLGRFDYYDFGCYRSNDLYFITVSRAGYRTRSLDVESEFSEVEVLMERE